MKTYDNGCYFTVTFTQDDANAFSDTWPCSTVHGKGSYQFQKSNGDLVDATGSALRGDGADWLAFSQDCQECGKRGLELKAAKQELREVRAEMKAKGIRRVSCFNGGLTPDEKRTNEAVFRLKTTIERLNAEPAFSNRPE